MRLLVASTEGAGHFNPLIPFVEAAVRRGDEVLAVVPPGLEPTVRERGHPYRLGAAPPADELAALRERFAQAPPDEAAVIANREIFARLGTAAMLPAHEAACREWRPDLVLHEPCDWASAIAAHRHGVPSAQVAISTAWVELASLDTAAPALEPYGDGTVARVRAEPYLTRFPESFDPSGYAVTRRYREASPDGVSARGLTPNLPDWWDGSDAPLVYVTFGSVAGGLPVGEVYRAALAAVAELPVRVLMTAGRSTDMSALGPLPANVHVEAWVPQGDILGDAAVVVCHGGSGTTYGTLAAGVPVVAVPLFADQPVNARLTAEAGAGLMIEPAPGATGMTDRIGLDDAPRIRAAIETVLDDPSYRAAARRVADEMRATPTVDELLATLAAEYGI